MTHMTSPGAKLRQAIADENPLQIVGTINAYTAMMAEKVGHKALYLSGAGVANASFGIRKLRLNSFSNRVSSQGSFEFRSREFEVSL